MTPERRKQLDWLRCIVTLACGIVGSAIFYGLATAVAAKFIFHSAQPIIDVLFWTVSLASAVAMVVIWRKLAKAFGFGDLVEAVRPIEPNNV